MDRQIPIYYTLNSLFGSKCLFKHGHIHISTSSSATLPQDFDGDTRKTGGVKHPFLRRYPGYAKEVAEGTESYTADGLCVRSFIGSYGMGGLETSLAMGRLALGR